MHRNLLIFPLFMFCGCSDRDPAPAPAPPPTGTEAIVAEPIEVMGTYATVKLWPGKKALPKDAAEAAYAVFRDVDARFSTYKPDSELSRLNRNAHEAPKYRS